ncbi:8-amino-7-oxononanoate synthase [Verrucomicrobiales bacterium]|jgi:8-amino-7-oxononanoate synthase|nr:8-amino-7-oxononanoate synthase [Verrucomicrobiales bacterium]
MRSPEEELADLAKQRLRRELRHLESPQSRSVTMRGGAALLNFSSNDYLGLANDSELKTRFAENIGQHGVGSGASRLVCGTLGPHLELEEALASLKGVKAALTFSTGFATATGVISGLCGRGDVVIADKLSHASLIDGAKLSGATLRVFPHNDLGKLEERLKWARKNTDNDARILVVTESIFSMDGDHAPLEAIIDLKERYGALLLVDEAHAFGIVGPQGRGLGSELDLDHRIDLQMGTFSKAVGLSGGYVCGSRAWIDLLINRARSFIYSTAPAPSLAATIKDALEVISGERGDDLRRTLWARLGQFSEETPASAIVPLILGENEAALTASEGLQEKGFLVPAIRYPTVPRGTARLRITFSAAHTAEDVDALKNALDDSGATG